LLDPIGGVAGDMLLGGLCELGVSLDELRAALSTLGFPGWSVTSRLVERRSLPATKVDVEAFEAAAVHRHLADILPRIADSGLTDRAKRTATAAFERLAEAEGRVHRCSANEVHFHEVGAIDAIIDIVGAAVALDRLGVERIFTGPLPAGSGVVRCAHGDMPCPAPAVVELCRDRFELQIGAGEGEMVTPTGAAVLAAVGERLPADLRLLPLAVGWGAGSRPASLLRLVLGEVEAGPSLGRVEAIDVLETTVDDLGAELIAYAAERLYAAGALDVACVATTAKKGRIGTAITVLVAPERRERVLTELMRQTGTLGVRVRRQERIVAERESIAVSTPWGPVQAKRGPFGVAPEYESAAAVARAHDVPLREVYAVVLAAVRGGPP
jgi:uncharacterized protein (TIGR00299 family) protein